MKDEGESIPANSDSRPDRGRSEAHPSGQSIIPQPAHRIEVVAAVIINQCGQFLLAQRPAGKVYAGFWEFPGGKVEPGESAGDALERELCEELGIRPVTAYPWLTQDFNYVHAAVRLRFFRVRKWSGELHGREQQQFTWQDIGKLTVAPLLPANGPVLRALELPSAYGISNAGEIGQERFLGQLAQSLTYGLRLVQVREKHLGESALVDFASRVVALCRQFGARVVINGPAAIAVRAGADGVHMTASELMSASLRPAVSWCGASCHDEAELAQARKIGVDFVVFGPVCATPSHSDTVPLGWTRFGEMIRDYPIPVYALGGLRIADTKQAWSCGAHGVAMMRGAWCGEPISV